MHYFLDKAHVRWYKSIKPKKGETNNHTKKVMSLREWIKFCFHLKGYTFKTFGQLHGVKAGTVGIVFTRPYPKMEKLIADTLEVQPWDLWPERYTDGKPNRPNLWYRRKNGLWKRKNKNTTNGFDVNKKEN